MSNHNVFEELLRAMEEGIRMPNQKQRRDKITVDEVAEICRHASTNGWKLRRRVVPGPRTGVPAYQFEFGKNGRLFTGSADPNEQQALANAAAHLRQCGI